MLKKLITSDKVYIGKSKIKNAGRGVFARCDIKKGEIIETSPIIEVPQGDMSNLKESILVTYFFYFGKNKQRLAIALGFGSMYNHSDKPNITYKITSSSQQVARYSISKERCFICLDSSPKQASGYSRGRLIKPKEQLIEFIAIEPINKDDELTFNYHDSSKQKGKKRPLWFEVVNPPWSG